MILSANQACVGRLNMPPSGIWRDCLHSELPTAGAASAGPVLSWYLLLRMEQRLDKLGDCLHELSSAIVKEQRKNVL